MDATHLAAEMLEPVPANATLGIRVVRAHNGFGEVGLDVHPALGNVIGSLHSSGLIGLVDASCLAAMISAADHRDQLNGFVPLGSRAEIEFRAPGRGRLVSRCRLSSDQLDRLRDFYAARAARAHVTTAADVVDGAGTTVCHGTFTWSMRSGGEHPSGP